MRSVMFISRFFWVAAFLFLLACEDSADEQITPTPQELLVKVSLAGSNINTASIDSATAIVRNASGNGEIRKSFILRNDTLLASFPMGTTTQELEILIHIKGGAQDQDQYFMYKKSNFTENLLVNGPTHKINDPWLQRIVFRDQNKAPVLTAGLRHNDPYLKLTVSEENKWDYFYFDKIVIYRQGDDSQEQASVFLEITDAINRPGFEDVNATKGLTELIAGKNWNEMHIYGILFDSDTGEEINFYYLKTFEQ